MGDWLKMKSAAEQKDRGVFTLYFGNPFLYTKRFDTLRIKVKSILGL